MTALPTSPELKNNNTEKILSWFEELEELFAIYLEHTATPEAKGKVTPNELTAYCEKTCERIMQTVGADPSWAQKISKLTGNVKNKKKDLVEAISRENLTVETEGDLRAIGHRIKRATDRTKQDVNANNECTQRFWSEVKTQIDITCNEIKAGFILKDPDLRLIQSSLEDSIEGITSLTREEASELNEKIERKAKELDLKTLIRFIEEIFENPPLHSKIYLKMKAEKAFYSKILRLYTIMKKLEETVIELKKRTQETTEKIKPKEEILLPTKDIATIRTLILSVLFENKTIPELIETMATTTGTQWTKENIKLFIPLIQTIRDYLLAERGEAISFEGMDRLIGEFVTKKEDTKKGEEPEEEKEELAKKKL